VLPEYHLASWVPEAPEFLQCAKDWKKYLDGYQALARELKVSIVPGTIIEAHETWDEDERLVHVKEQDVKDVLLNVCYFIGPDGEILGKYIKKNLWYVLLSFSHFDSSFATNRNMKSGTRNASISCPPATHRIPSSPPHWVPVVS
jgi:predicted amidohydrolase